MAISGIPPYSNKVPLAVFVRCGRCRQRYLVWTGAEDPKTQTPAGDYLFIDARVTPFTACSSCGEVMDFLGEDEGVEVM